MRLRASRDDAAHLGGFLAAGLLAIGLIAGASTAQATETLTLQTANPDAIQVAAAEEAPGEPEYSKGGTAGCLECHDETEQHPVFSIFHTAHAQMGDPRTPLAQHGCESCHGPSAAHADKPRRYLPAVRFDGPNKSSAEALDKTCISCHEGGLRMHWQGSQHEAADVACSSCHTIHATRDPVLAKKSQPEVCESCHKEKRAETFRFSHHPIREGKVACSDCHNPHGSFGPKLLKKATVNDTCFQCHQEKRGPFLWEHAPVVDNCMNCHNPHGSSQPRLLKARGPYLCQECHLANFHPSTLYAGNGLVGGTQSNMSRLLVKNCLNCHFAVHGSNHPAGSFFTR